MKEKIVWGLIAVAWVAITVVIAWGVDKCLPF